MRLYRKNPMIIEKMCREDFANNEVDYKTIYEDVKNYLVFRISVTTDLTERLVYLDVLEYMRRIQLEAKKTKVGW